MKFLSTAAVFLSLLSLHAAVDLSNYIKRDKAGDRFMLKEYVNDCFKAGVKKITLPEGKFLVSQGVAVTRKKDFTISGAGADKTTLVFQHLKPVLEGKSAKVQGVPHGFFIENCSNFKLSDFAVDFDPLPFVQGTITEVRKNGREFLLKLHKGYPRANKFFTTGNVSGVYFFDAQSRRYKTGVFENYYRQTIVDKDTYLCTNAAYAEWNINRIKPGDMAAFGFRSICAFRMEICSNFRLENLTVYSAPGMAYYSMYSTDHFYNNIKIIRGPKPAGATEERLLSSVADGFTHRYAFTGPVLENSEFSFMGDDSVNISSHVHPVVKIAGKVITIAARYPDMRLDLLPKVLNEKSTAVFTSFKDWSVTASPKITAIKKVKGTNITLSDAFIASWRLRKTKQSFYEIILAQELPANVKIGDGVYFPDMNGRGFVIRNNFFHDHRAVGLRLMAEDGLVENNRFEHIAFGAIELAGSMGVWRESGWSKNVVIRNNTIKGVNAHPVTNDHMAAIASRVEYRGYLPEKYARCHENILISGNRITDTYGGGISIVGGNNIKIENNIVENYNLVPSDKRGYNENLVAGYGICVQQSGKVELKDNKVSEPGIYSRGKEIIDPPNRKVQAVADVNAVWNIKGNSAEKGVLYPHFNPKGGVTLLLNGKVLLTDTNGIGVLQTVPRERGIGGWGNLDWQRRTPSPVKNVSADKRSITFVQDDEDIKITKSCKMVSPQEFHVELSGSCKAGDTFMWTALLPEKSYTQALLLECDGDGYPLKKISPLSADCFKGRKYLRDMMRYNIKRMVIQLPGGEKVKFEFAGDVPVEKSPRDRNWFLMGGRGSTSDFQLRNRMRYLNDHKQFCKFTLGLKVTLLPPENKEK